MLVPLLRLLSLGAAAVANAAPAAVTLPSGATITGSLEPNVAGNQVQVFRGIPYAEAPVGDKRWKPSTLKPVSADLNATAYGSVCHAVAMFGPGGDQPPASEDCLFLNVFAPAGATRDSKLPVMVWIHGGAFVAGSSNSEEAHNILAAAGEKVVVVNLNYRLGVFGFFSNAQLLGEGQGANFGLRDQAVAFEWVKKYIEHFGGDPDDITAFGESAGSMSIAMHMLSHEGDQQLFRRAIMQSGTYTTTHDTATPAVQQNQTDVIASAVGCRDATDVLACLRKADAAAVLKAGGALNWIPTVDGEFMVDMPIRRLLAGKVSRVPTIVGTNADEGWLFTFQAAEAAQYDSFVRGRFSMLSESEFTRLAELYPASAFATPHHRTGEIFGDVIFVCPSQQFSQTLAGTETYRYRFNLTSTEFGPPLVVHAKDVAYVFNHVAMVPKDDDSQQVVAHFQRFWTNFALTGSPNTSPSDATQAGVVGTKWPLFTLPAKQQLVIQPELAIETSGSDRAGHDERCAFWLDVEKRITDDIAFI